MSDLDKYEQSILDPESDPQSGPRKETPQKTLFLFIRAFLLPTLIGKSFVVYFGLNYSQYPGEGYGYGLLVSVVFTVTMLVLFFWKFRNVEDL